MRMNEYVYPRIGAGFDVAFWELLFAIHLELRELWSLSVTGIMLQSQCVLLSTTEASGAL